MKEALPASLRLLCSCQILANRKALSLVNLPKHWSQPEYSPRFQKQEFNLGISWFGEGKLYIKQLNYVITWKIVSSGKQCMWTQLPHDQPLCQISTLQFSFLWSLQHGEHQRWAQADGRCTCVNDNQTLLYFTLIYLFYVYGYFTCMCIFVSHAWCLTPTKTRRKRVSDPLEVVVEIAVAHHVGTGNQAWVLCKSSESD